MPIPEGIGAALPPSNPLQTFVSGVSSFINNIPTYVSNYSQNYNYTQQAAQNVIRQQTGYAGVPLQAPNNPYQQQVYNAYNTGQTYNYANTLQTYSAYANPGSPINITIQPQPITVNIPAAQQSFTMPTIPDLINQFIPNGTTFLGLAQQLLNTFQPALDKLFGPLTSQWSQLLNNFTTNFEVLQRNLNKTMYSIDISASQSPQVYAEVAASVTRDILNNANLQAVNQNTTLNNALNQINKNNELLVNIASQYHKQAQDAFNELVSKRKEEQQLSIDEIIKRVIALIDGLSKLPGIILKVVTDIFEQIFSELGKKIGAHFEKLFSGYNAILKDVLGNKIKDLDDLMRRIKIAGGNSDLLNIALNVMVVSFGIFALLQHAAKPITMRFDQLILAKDTPALLGSGDYIEHLYREPKLEEWLTEQLHKTGLSNEQIAVAYRNAEQYLTPDDIIQAFRRNFIDRQQADDMLAKYRLSRTSRELLFKISNVIPGISDIISMMVHDVFSPADRERYQLDRDYPEQMTEIARYSGLSEYWARNYWAGHWQYPSVQMVMEMYHRRNYAPELKGFSQDDVDDFLRLADYAPIWRPRLRAIAYNTLGRIDIRRLFKAGGKDTNWLIRHYEAEGYNPTDVQDLVDWTVNTQLPEDETDISKLNDKVEATLQNRYIAGALNLPDAQNILRYLKRSEDYIARAIPLWDLIKQISGMEDEQAILSNKVKSAVINARKRGNISNALAKRMLISTGMSEPQAELNLHYADLEYTVTLKSKAQDVYQKQYALHNIDEIAFKAALATYEFSNDEINRALLEADLMREDKTKKPGEKDIETWYKDGVIDDSQLQEELRGLGYQEKYVQYKFKDLSKGKI